MSAPNTPSARRVQVADPVDDDDEDESLLPDAEKTKDDGQAAAGDDGEDGVLFEDDEIAKQAAFSGQINEDMK